MQSNQVRAQMMNIPTDLLRTLVAVVDLRSFTKAAQSFGVTQPAVSAQIKRLQFLLGLRAPGQERAGCEPDAARAGGGQPRPPDAGDQRPDSEHHQRQPGDQDGSDQHTGRFRRGREFRQFWRTSASAGRCAIFRERRTVYDQVAHALKQGDLDLAVALSKSEPHDRGASPLDRSGGLGAREATQLDPHGPVPLVSFGEECACQRAATRALKRAGRDCDFVYSSRSLISLAAAVGRLWRHGDAAQPGCQTD